MVKFRVISTADVLCFRLYDPPLCGQKKFVQTMKLPGLTRHRKFVESLTDLGHRYELSFLQHFIVKDIHIVLLICLVNSYIPN